MRRARTVLALLLTALLAACQADERFRTAGAGASLYSPELATTTRETEDYFGFLCRRAGLVSATPPLNIVSAMTQPSCPVSTPADWRILVAAGYNDIDRRCDDYLGWLLEKRNQRFFTNQTLAALTTLLGGLTVATGAAEAIGYVGMALGLASTVYNSYQDTLLNGLETTTILKTVQARRTQFRIAFQKQAINSRPDAEYALGSYLRICTPASIIMDANISALAFSAGESVPPQAEQLKQQTQALLSFGEQQVAAPPPPPPPPPDVPDNRIAAERNVPFSKIGEIQTFLGVTPDRNIGATGSGTRAAIAEFERGMIERQDGKNLGVSKVTGTLTGPTRQLLGTIVDQKSSVFQSPFERAFLGNPETKGRATKFMVVDPDALVALWAVLAPGLKEPPSDQILAEIRKKIQGKRRATNPEDNKTYLDSTLWNRIKPTP